MIVELGEPDVALRVRRLDVESPAILRQAHHPRTAQIDLFAGELPERHDGDGASAKVEYADVLTFEVDDLVAVGSPLRRGAAVRQLFHLVRAQRVKNDLPAHAIPAGDELPVGRPPREAEK